MQTSSPAPVQPTLSTSREEKLRRDLSDLEERERTVREELRTAQKRVRAKLEKIQTQKHELNNELLDAAVHPDPLELTPDMADEAIRALRAEFFKPPHETEKAGYVVQFGMKFAPVEAKLRLEENVDKLKAIYRMVQAGSRPAVVCEKDGRYCIAETFDQTLPERANCAYDVNAEREIGSENCNGNAVTQSQKMDVPLMERRIAEAHFTEFSKPEKGSSDLIQATKDERERGETPYLYRRLRIAEVRMRDAAYSSDLRGWRGAIWV